MGEIDRGDLDRWMAVTRVHLLTGPRRPSQRPILLCDRRPDQAHSDTPSRSGKDRFLSRVRQRLFLLLRDIGGQDECAMRRLERTFRAQVSFIASRPDIPRRILSWSLHSADPRLQRRVRKVVVHYEFRVLRLIAAGQQQGCIRADIEPQAATELFVAMLQSLVLRLPGDHPEPEILARDADRLFSAYRELVRPAADP